MVTTAKETRKIGLRFSERMAGYLAQGEDDFAAVKELEKKQNNLLSFEVTIQIEKVSDFCKLSGRKALLEGTVSFKPLGQKLPIRNGELILFRPERQTGQRHMTYSLWIACSNGNTEIWLAPKPGAPTAFSLRTGRSKQSPTISG